MMAAATVSRRRVLRMRAARRSSSVAPSVLISGIMLTPVSNPDSPSTSSGKASTAVRSISPGLACAAASVSRQAGSCPGSVRIWTSPAATTTAFSSR